MDLFCIFPGNTFGGGHDNLARLARLGVLHLSWRALATSLQMLRAMLRFVLIATVLPGLNAQCETAAANVEFTLSKNEHLKVEWQDGTGEGWDNARSTSPGLPFKSEIETR